MILVQSIRQVQNLNPVFGDKNGVYFTTKGYGDFLTYYFYLAFETGFLYDYTPIVTNEIQRCINSGRLYSVDLLDKSILERSPVLFTNYNHPEAAKHNFEYDLGKYFVELNPEQYQRVNKHIVEALILALTGEIDGDQFVKGIIAAGPMLGLSEGLLDLVKNLKITRIYTGGLKLETQRLVHSSELYLIR